MAAQKDGQAQAPQATEENAVETATEQVTRLCGPPASLSSRGIRSDEGSVAAEKRSLKQDTRQ
jgi:hypothetical protein